MKDVAGQDFAVDAMTTGFAFVMRELMARNEIAPAQVRFVKVGGGAQRLQALLAGQQQVTLLNTPLDIIAEAHGFHPLLRVTDVLGPYQGIVAAVRRDRVTPDRARLEAFTAGFHQSVGWLMRPEHREQAIDLLVGRMTGMTRPTAEAAYAVLTDPEHGIFRDLQIHQQGLRNVLALRARYAVPARPLGAPAAYIDDSVRAAAVR
jgi:ABC-type nitrate/sulfonate/bicarbonate transport system substrate-binding protein